MQGLQIFDASGQLTMTTDTLVGRYLGYFSTGVSNGSVADGRLSSGTPYYFAESVGLNTDTTILCQPIVSISDAGISWSFPDFQAGNGSLAPRVAINIFYGVH
ncbi:hypothetical protein [Pseudomonas sp. GM79]|uniref:hypothetical protein n=1 Tax=Pseudomonas sp. GM79 TaxID=1144338 RepID=UPI0012FA2582|nr:hypothetical protein [Pseudomonas sp. GM79]